MARLLDRTKQVLAAGADFVILPERPIALLSEEESELFGAGLVRVAEEASATIIGCNLHTGDSGGGEYAQVLGPGGDGVTSLAVRLGRRAAPVPLETARTTLGEIAVLSSTDCFDRGVFPGGVGHLPHCLVMQVSASSALEREAIRELALARSEAQVSLVVVTSLWGSADSVELCGGTSIMLQGETLAEASEGDEALLADIDPADYVDLELLHHDVRIPELLRQKLEHL